MRILSRCLPVLLFFASAFLLATPVRAATDAEKKIEEKKKKAEEDKKKKEEQAKKAGKAAPEDPAVKAADEKARREEEAEAKKAAAEAVKKAAEEEVAEAKIREEIEAIRRKSRWLDVEIEFIEKLAEKDYRDIAESMLAALKAGKLGEIEKDQQSYLKRGEVRLWIAILPRLKDTKEKIEKAGLVIKVMKEIVAATPDDDKVFGPAVAREHAETLFRVGLILAEEGLRSGNAELCKAADQHFAEATVPAVGKDKKSIPPPLDRAQGEVDQRFQDTFALFEEDKRNVKLRTRLEAALIDKIKFQHPCEAAFGIWPHLLPRGTDKCRKQAEKGEEYLSSLLFEYENYLPADKQVYLHWMRLLGANDDPMFDEDSKGRFGEIVDPAQAAEERENYAHYLWPSDRLRFFFERHFVKPKEKGVDNGLRERALAVYAEAIFAHLRGTKALLAKRDTVEMCKPQALALLDKEPADAKKKDGAALLDNRDKLAKAIEELKKQLAPPVVKEAEEEKPKDPAAKAAPVKKAPPPPKELSEERKKQLQALLDSLVKLHEAMIGADHEIELQTECQKAMEDLGRSTSKLLGIPVSPHARANAILHVKQPYHLWRARLLMGQKEPDAKKATLELEAAMGACGQIANEFPAWKPQAQARIVEVSKAAEELKLSIVSIDADIAEADRKMQAAVECRDTKKQKDLYREALLSYLGVQDKMRSVTDKERRLTYQTKVLERIGVCSLKVDNLLYGYAAGFEVVQQFPPLRYPWDKYPGMEKIFTRGVQNLLYAAQRLSRDDPTDVTRELYADALLLTMEADPRSSPKMRPSLVTQLKAARSFKAAIEVVEQTPAAHPYYRLLILQGASVCQDPIRDLRKQMRPLDAEKDKELFARLTAQISLWEKKSGELASRFVELWRKRAKLPADADDELKEIFRQEDQGVLDAFLAPISTAVASEKYADALAMIENYYKEVAGLTVEDRLKQKNLGQINRLKLVALTRRTDPKTGDLEALRQNLEAAEKICPEIEAIADEAVKDSLRSEVNLALGKLWNQYASRLEKEKNDAENSGKAKLKGNEFLRKVEGEIYKDFALFLLIGKNYFEQGKAANEKSLFEHAVDVYDKGIAFWSGSLFHKSHLFQAGKTLAEFKAAAIPATVRARLAGILNPDELAKAESEEKLTDALNAFLKYDPVPQKVALEAAFTAMRAEAEAKLAEIKSAPPKNEAEGERARKTAQDSLDLALRAQEVLQRADLAQNPEVKQNLNRMVLSLAYPALLAPPPLMPLLPSVTAFDEALRDFKGKYPATADGRRKGTVALAMHDPSLIRLDDDKAAVTGYRTDLQKRGEIADPDTKSGLQDLERLLEPGLKLIMYGGQDAAGKPIKPNYARARGQIDGLLRFNNSEMTLDRAVELPTKSFLSQITRALQFSGGLVLAKKKYAEALVAVGRQADALVYLNELRRFYPDDWDLLLGIASAYTAMGVQLSQKEYDENASRAFLLARIEASQIVKRAAEGTPFWWDVWRGYLNNETEEVLARKAKGKPEPMTVSYEIDRGGKKAQGKTETLKLEDQALETLKKLYMIEGKAPAVGETPAIDENVEEIRQMIKKLGEAGYKIPAQPAPAAEGAPAPAAAAPAPGNP